MHRRFSCRSPETARDLYQHHEHYDCGNNEIAQDKGFVPDAAGENRADADVAVDRGVSNESKLPARQAPGERCAAGEHQRDEPYPVAAPIKDAGEQSPKQNGSNDVQIRAEKMRFETAPLKKQPPEADHEAVEEGTLAICRVLMGRPARDRQSEPPGKRRQSERQDKAVVESICKEEKEDCSC